jgi:hypothetical protein
MEPSHTEIAKIAGTKLRYSKSTSAIRRTLSAPRYHAADEARQENLRPQESRTLALVKYISPAASWTISA